MQQKCNSAPKCTLKYACEKCAFTCSEKSKYNRHLLTAKHQNATKCNEMQPVSDISENKVFECITCNYITHKQCNYTRHTLTNKHLKKTKCNTSAETSDESSRKLYCECGKTYSHRSSLWVHMQRCQARRNDKTMLVSAEVDTSEKVNRVFPVSHNFISEPDDTTISDTIQAMVNAKVEEQIAKMGDPSITKLLEAQADAHAVAAAEQTCLLIEAISLKGPQCITNNTTNNQFNLNVFLNEDCKDAYTLKEVMDSIVCTVSDLDRMDNDGYVATITRKILESIQNMSITERPIHCTDARRNTVCAKDESGWERNEKAMKMLADSVFKVGQKLGRMVDDWRLAYPDHFRGTATRREQYHRLVTNIMRVHDLEVEARIVSKVCKGVILDRKTVMDR